MAVYRLFWKDNSSRISAIHFTVFYYWMITDSLGSDFYLQLTDMPYLVLAT